MVDWYWPSQVGCWGQNLFLKLNWPDTTNTCYKAVNLSEYLGSGMTSNIMNFMENKYLEIISKLQSASYPLWHLWGLSVITFNYLKKETTNQSLMVGRSESLPRVCLGCCHCEPRTGCQGPARALLWHEQTASLCRSSRLLLMCRDAAWTWICS